MSFLDNLENNLKSLESREEGGEAADRQQRARESERAQAQAIAPFAEQLKKSAFTAGVLSHAARVFGRHTRANDSRPAGVMMNVPPCAINSTGHASWGS